MAKFEQEFKGNFYEVLEICDHTINEKSVSVSYEDGSDFCFDNVKVAVRVYERYSYFGGNRVSLNLTIVGDGENICLSAITSGGSQAVMFKLNTVGEEAFLGTLVPALKDYINKYN